MLSFIIRYRRNVLNFSDRVLPNILEVSFFFLKNFSSQQSNFGNQFIEEEFLKTVLNLIFSALNFDFLGEKSDFTEIFKDEYAPLQIPSKLMKNTGNLSKWAFLSNEDTIHLIFENYYISEKLSYFTYLFINRF